MDPIKEAFSKIKEDIASLKQEIITLRNELVQTRDQTHTLSNEVKQAQQTNQHTQNQTHNLSLGGPYHPNRDSSIGNKGVPTDKPTNQQTNKPTQNTSDLPINDPIEEFRKANEILSELDGIKSEIRIKFKGLTPQEMAVFETLYLLESNKRADITYKTIANSIKLSESSIRDYINKLISKGIPINKSKINNKQVSLNISKDLKDLTTIETIRELRAL